MVRESPVEANDRHTALRNRGLVAGTSPSF